MKDPFQPLIESTVPLSEELRSELSVFYTQFLNTHFPPTAKPCAGMTRAYGELADTPVARIVQYSRIKPGRDTDALTRLSVLGGVFSQAIQDNNHTLFQGLAEYLKAREEGRAALLKRSDISVPPKRGRAKQPYDLSAAVPMAVCRVIRRRLIDDPERPITNMRIGRYELMVHIFMVQWEAGAQGGTPISSSELSRWIKKLGIGKFMGPRVVRKKADI